jgi:hypothetical protein
MHCVTVLEHFTHSSVVILVTVKDLTKKCVVLKIFIWFCSICFLQNVFCYNTYCSFMTRVSQLKIWHSWVTGIERNVCRCTFNRYSVITPLQNSPLENSCFVVVALIENYSTSESLKTSPEKSQILSCDTLVANERYAVSWAWDLPKFM